MNTYSRKEIEKYFTIDRIDVDGYIEGNNKNYSHCGAGFVRNDDYSFSLNGFYLYYEDKIFRLRGFKPDNIICLVNKYHKDMVSIPFRDLPIENLNIELEKIYNKLQKLMAFK